MTSLFLNIHFLLDIAVAAPYENENSGVVYIFRGDKQSGLNREPAQKIIGKDIIPTIRGFGISLSKPADIDGNHYNGKIF